MDNKILLILVFSSVFICIFSITVGGGTYYYYQQQTGTTAAGTTAGTTGTTAGSTAGSTTAGTTAGTTGSTTGSADTQTNQNGCMKNWKYSYDNYNKLETISGCTELGSAGKPWCMLPAYVVGGRENVAWKYTEDENDPECLTNWTYYDGSGNVVKNGNNIERTITWDSGSDNTNRWCPIKTYISQGNSKPLENKSWKYC